MSAQPSEPSEPSTSPTSIPRPAGLVLAPFRALRPAPAAGAPLLAVLSPPYDVIDEAQRAELELRDPHNLVRLILPRDKPAQPGSRYAAAAELLGAWTAGGALVRDDAPALYVYEEAEASGHTQRGLLGGVGLVPPEAGIVLPHENTMAGPVADRLALLTATRTDLEPIFLVYDGGGAASTAVASVAATAPLADTTDAEGTRHRLWALTDPDELTRIAADLLPRRAVIADGHHRYATYLQHQAQRHAAGAGPGGWDHGLALLVDASQFGPQVHAIHRVVPGLPLREAVRLAAAGMQTTALPDLRAGDASPALAALAGADPAAPAFVVSDGRSVALLHHADAAGLAAAVPADRSPAWRGLDVTVAHRYLIEELWGLADREDIVGFAHDVEQALAAARESGGTALLLRPTPVEAVLAVAAAAERMPRKSTLFTPKPRTGLVLRPHSA